MGVNATAMIVPGNGTIFHAPKAVAFPTNPLAAFTLTGTPPEGWTNLGHTSRENTLGFSREGGEASSIGTWLADSTKTIYSSVAWAMSIPALQFDSDVLDMAFNGDFDPVTGGYIVPGQTAAIETQLYVLMQDNTGKLGFWIPNSEVTLGEPPTVNREQYLELPLTASINAADNDVIPAVEGRPGIMELFKTGLVAPPTTP